ncbi:MAG: substrate-binding domain-containing protein [Clostridia bacterium]|nr:substrate-binding domain-containing protein [Clostridia bacterium]
MKKHFRKLMSGALVLTMAAALAGCGSTSTSSKAASSGSSSSAGSSEGSSAVSSSASASSSSTAEADSEGDIIKKGDYVIGLSNSYFGNTWRKQMASDFEDVAKEAKSEGIISDYEIQNGDNTVNAQIQQINSFILKGVDAIIIDAASPTAINSVLEKAMKAGIVVVAFDCTLEDDKIPQVVFDFNDFGETRVNDIADILGVGTDKPINVVEVRGLEGTSAETGMHDGVAAGLKAHPNFNVVGTVYGSFSATATQEELSKILPSLPKVDAVITQCGGDSYGAVQAFEQSGKDMPLILGDNGAEYIDWWKQQSEKDPNFKAISRSTSPSVCQVAFWAALYALNGGQIPQKMVCNFATISQDVLPSVNDMPAGSMYSPAYSWDWTYENILNKK